ncbi:hypothetical protein SAMN02910298_02954 [Pseudobutyrivibrio sp. YE44]|uniref:putative glycoside hydrolase n=1 Tax=Pseudobutyrivibrio sp. YE44 TaxID=1520802 RepID=UPI0008868E10|nr:putative glycoside hydrolase [Pseudobutyrivibrio sp. YE44]SDB57354.1 hypothetical protein SAMN02910298_02954 [Pseudobutyrivibrio sp. YE44]
MRRYLSAIGLLAFVGVLFLFSYRNTKTKNEIIDKIEQSICQEEKVFTKSDWKKSHTKVCGLYVTGPIAGTEKMDEIINIINNSDANAIVLDVKDDFGNITFKMDNQYVQENEACIPYISDIEGLLSKLKENNIYVIARIPCFKDPILAKAKSDLCLKTSDGTPVTDANGNEWVNPAKEEVWEYIISIAETCCELGFDEIQLDYVRFPVGQNAEEAIYGVDTNDDNRQRYINEFLTRACDSIHRYNVPVSADVFGTIIKSNEDASHIGQDYVNLACSLDIICPMIYPSHYAAGEFGIDLPDANPYETINAALNGSQTVLSATPEYKCAVVRPWLQAFTATWIPDSITYDSYAINMQIQALHDAGYEEWILWNSKSDYSMGGF